MARMDELIRMDESNGVAGDPIAQLVLGQFDAPAFIRRAKSVEMDTETLFFQCQKHRNSWLHQPQRSFHGIKARVGGTPPDWQRLLAWSKQPEQIAYLHALDPFLEPALRFPPKPARWFWGISQEIETLRSQIRSFNQAWLVWVRELDFTQINSARDGYNKWYLLEKECSVLSRAVASQGFEPLPLLQPDDILARFPLLPETGNPLFQA